MHAQFNKERASLAPDALSEAKRRLSLLAVMALLGDAAHAKKSARCPLHDDSTNSFSVFVGRDGIQRWKCFAGCGGGDVIDYIARKRGVSKGEAIREFKRLAGVNTGGGR